MLRLVTDTSAVNKITKTPGAHAAVRTGVDRGDLEILYTHDVIDELAATPDRELRERLLATIRDLGNLTPATAFALDYSRLDSAPLPAEGDVPRIEALRSNSVKHTRDALIAFAAGHEACVLLTGEKRRQPNTARRQGIEVLDVDQLLDALGIHPAT